MPELSFFSYQRKALNPLICSTGSMCNLSQQSKTTIFDSLYQLPDSESECMFVVKMTGCEKNPPRIDMGGNTAGTVNT